MDENVKKKFKVAMLVSSIGCAPLFLMFFCVLVVVLFVLGLFDGGESTASGCRPVKSADTICESIDVSGYGSMSVDEYVAGVVEHEFGGAPEEVLKAQAVAARSYGLAGAVKENGNCTIGDTSEGFQTFSPNPSESSKKAAEDTSGMILVDENGNVARSEYSSNSLPQAYDSFGDTITMSERNLEIPRSWFSTNKTCDNSSLNTKNSNKDAYGRDVYGCGHGRGMGQIAAKYLALEKGYTYEQILEYFYGADSEYKWTLASTNGTSNQICSGNLQTLDHYTLYHEGLTKLTKPLSSDEISNLNNYLEGEIKKAGHGHGAAVAAVGQGLVYWLEQNRKEYLGYYWGGGHGDTIIGGDPKWGTYVGISVTSGGNSTGPEYGLDCSGFVSWATRMACNPNFGSDVSGGWNNRGDRLTTVKNAEPGDVITNSSHIMLVVKNNGDGTVIVAEETGSKGLIFSSRDDNYASSYSIRSMKSWYANNCTDIQEGTGSSSSGNVSSNDDLSKQIKSYIESNAANGKWSVYVKNLKTNKVSSINASQSMTSASVIKLFIAGAAFDQINQNKFSINDLRGRLKPMIEESDNDAANSLIKTLYMGDINSYISSNGYKNTKLKRNFGESGLENIISAQDVGKFLENVYRGKIVNSDYSNVLLGYLKNQRTRVKIPAGLGCQNCSASKSGELPDKGVANDAAIVYSPAGDYIIVVLSEVGSSNYNIAEGNVRDISKIVYDYFN